MKKIFRSFFNSSSVGILFQATVNLRDFKPLADVRNSQKLSTLYASGDLATYINRMFFFALSLGAIFGVVKLMIAGYKYMMDDMVSSKSAAKTTIGNVVFGLLVLMSVWIILNQINPDILKINVVQDVQANRIQNNTPSSGGTQQTTMYDSGGNAVAPGDMVPGSTVFNQNGSVAYPLPAFGN